MRKFIRRAISNYDFYKGLEETEQSLAEGKLAERRINSNAPNGRTARRSFLCERCNCYRRSWKLVRVPDRIAGIGHRVPGMVGRYLEVCWDCAPKLERQVAA